MEQIGTIAKNAQMQTLSQNQQISTPTTTSILSREQHAALFAYINKARMLNGWQTRTAQELDQTIRTWGEMLNSYNIPASAYPDLYKRCFDVRQERLRSNPQDVPSMDATLIVSQWTGSFGLKAELKQREIDAGRTLGTNAESVCQHCFGTGFRTVQKGNYNEAVKCEH